MIEVPFFGDGVFCLPWLPVSFEATNLLRLRLPAFELLRKYSTALSSVPSKYTNPTISRPSDTGEGIGHLGTSIYQLVKAEEMDGYLPKRCPVKTRASKWKEKLREECLLRVQENRNQLLWKIRSAGTSVVKPKEIVVSAFGQIVSDELAKIKCSSESDGHNAVISDTNNTLWHYEPSEAIRELDKNEYEDIMLEMERLLHEDIEAELKLRDAALIEDYEKTCELEEEYLAAAFFEHMQLQEDQNGGLLCPICRKGYLKQQKQLIYCECCQLRLDLQSDQVDLELLKKRLSEVLEEHHNRGCKAQPEFYIEGQFDISALYMQCSVCETFELVL